MRYFVIWARLGRVLVNKLSADTLSTCQLNISQHVSQLSVNKLYQSTSVRWVSVDMLADILADSWPRVGRYVRRKVSKLPKIWKLKFVKRFKQESMLTIHWKSNCCEGLYSFELFKFHDFPWLFPWPFQIFYDLRFSCHNFPSLGVFFWLQVVQQTQTLVSTKIRAVCAV